jgi:acetyl-CoA hydrolase
MNGVLNGVRIIEIAGVGPGPFCGMLLADLGAEVICIERAGGVEIPTAGIMRRGKQSVVLDLKNPDAVQAVLCLIDGADALIEGMRPGTMERLGLGPEICLARNPRLVYGRMTGWGQSGPLAHSAGHDTNYIALSGALWYAGDGSVPPVAPPTLVGDLGGGAMYLAVGLLAGILNARATGSGQVVDAAIVDGAAHMMNLMLDLAPGGQTQEARSQSLLDGPHWYATYRCADGLDITVGALEAKFYQQLLAKLGLSDDVRFQQQYDKSRWAELKQRMADLFGTQRRAHWLALFDGSDACVAPVLSPFAASQHPHIAERAIYAAPGEVLQANPAPRFSDYPVTGPNPIPQTGADTRSVLGSAGIDSDVLERLVGK